MASSEQRLKRSLVKTRPKVDKLGMSDEMIEKICDIVDNGHRSQCPNPKSGGSCLLKLVNGTEQRNETQEFFGDCVGTSVKDSEYEPQCLQTSTCFCDLRNKTNPLTYIDDIICLCKENNRHKKYCKYQQNAKLGYINHCNCNPFFRVQCYGRFDPKESELSISCEKLSNKGKSFENTLPCCSNKYLLEDFFEHNRSDCSHVTTTVPPPTTVTLTTLEPSLKHSLGETSSSASKSEISNNGSTMHNTENNTTQMVPTFTTSSHMPLLSGQLELNSSSSAQRGIQDAWMSIYNPICIVTPFVLILIFMIMYFIRRACNRCKDERRLRKGAERLY